MDDGIIIWAVCMMLWCIFLITGIILDNIFLKIVSLIFAVIGLISGISRLR